MNTHTTKEARTHGLQTHTRNTDGAAIAYNIDWGTTVRSSILKLGSAEVAFAIQPSTRLLGR